MGLTLLSSVTIDHPGAGTRTLQLCQGDLSNMLPADYVDILVVSALPGDYSPTPGSLIGALSANGVSVQQLSGNKAFNYEPVLPTWASQPITNPSPGIEFGRIVVYEPANPATTSAQLISTIFQSVQAFQGSTAATVALPLVSTGSGGADPSLILRELFFSAAHGAATAFPLNLIKLVIYNQSQVAPLLALFNTYVYNYTNLPTLSGLPGNYSGYAGQCWSWAQANAGNFPNMTARQLFGVQMYTSNYYGTINGALRANSLVDPTYMAIEPLIEAIDSGLSNIVASPGLTYRGINSLWNPFTPGTTVLELAYTSTSRPASGFYYSAPYKINLTGQTGKPIANISQYPSENEILYHRLMNELVTANANNLIECTEVVVTLP
ncbi:MAG: ADP-ribosyltransferase [Bacteroidota bacterium]